MSTTLVSGQIGIKAISAVATQKRDVGLGIALLDPKVAPLVLMSQVGMDVRNIADVAKARLAKTSAIDPKIEWIEDVLQPTVDAVNLAAGYTSGDTSIAVDNGEYFPTNCYAYVSRTGEIMKVTTGGSSPLTVSRAALGTTAAALLDNDELIILDALNLDGSTPPTASSTQKVLNYNYLEIVRTPVDMTETTQNTAMLGEERDWDYQKRKKGIEHAVKIERKFLYSGRAYSASGAQAVWSTGGLATMITTNAYDAGGTLTEKQFNNNVAGAVFKNGRGSNYRVLLASERLNSVICDWGQNKVRLNVGENKLGFVINQYVTPSGIVYIVPHHLIGGLNGGVCGIMIDPEKIKYRYLQNMDTSFRDDVVKDGRLGKVSEYVSQVGLEIRNQETCALIKNVLE